MLLISSKLPVGMLLLALTAGCSEDAAEPKRSVLLAPERAALTDTVATTTCAQGDRFLAVEVALTNELQAAIPLAAGAFSVTSASAESYPGDTVTGSHPKGCKQDGTIAPGGQDRCTVVFKAPIQAEPATIVYTAPDGARFSAALPAITPCQACGQRCVDTSFDKDNCGACGQAVGLGSCFDGSPVCAQGASECTGSCVDLQTDPHHCGACNAQAGTTAVCVDGKKQPCTSTEPNACGNKCVNLLWDPANCGSCAEQCAAPALCEQGLCCDQIESKELVSCETICGARKCETKGATYSGPCNGTTKIVLGTVSTCHDTPTATETVDGCTLPFSNIDCSCCD